MGRKTVLCNVSHYGRISHMMAYAMACHRDDDCYLILDQGWFGKETLEFISKKESIPPFVKFLTYNENTIKDDRSETAIVEYFDDLLGKLGLDIGSIDTVYTCFDTIHAFGIYLSIKEKHHILLDTNLSTSTDNSKIFDRTEYHRLLGDRRALTWNSPLVDKVIYTLGNSAEEIKEKLIKNNHPSRNREAAVGKEVEFHTLETAFERIGPEGRNELIRFFVDEEFNERSNLLLMTSSFFIRDDYYTRYLYRMEKEEIYTLPYRFLMDRVKKNFFRLIVKAHPNDAIPTEVFEKSFPHATYIPGYVPSDIMKFIDMNIELGISPGSNSISTMDIENSLTLPRDYFKHYDLMYLIPLMEDLSSRTMCNRVSFKKLTDELVAALSNMFDKVQNSLMSVGYYGSWELYMNDKNPVAYPFISLEDGVPEDMPEGRILEITFETEDQDGVFDLKPKYFLFLDQDLLHENYTFTLEGRYTRTVMKVRVVDSVKPCSELTEQEKLEKYAESGNESIRFRLAEEYYDKKTSESLRKAISLIRPLVNRKEYPNAKFILINSMFELKAGLMQIRNEIELIEDSNFRNVQTGRLYCVNSNMTAGAEYFKKAYLEGNENTKREVCGWLWRFNNEKTNRVYFEIASRHVESHPTYKAHLARCYRDGRGTEKDLKRAAELMEEAAGLNRYLEEELCDILWRMKDPEGDVKHAQICMNHPGESYYQAHLARCYRDGRGAEVDVAKAIEYMRMASKERPVLNEELCNMLWTVRTPEADEEHFRICKEHVKDSPFYKAHLARSYRNGRGVEKNLSKAIDHMRSASKDRPNLNEELCDMLWSANTPEMDREHFEMSMKGHNAGNPYFTKHLIKAYMSGRGVEKDEEKAKELQSSFDKTC